MYQLPLFTAPAPAKTRAVISCPVDVWYLKNRTPGPYGVGPIIDVPRDRHQTLVDMDRLRPGEIRALTGVLPDSTPSSAWKTVAARSASQQQGRVG